MRPYEDADIGEINLWAAAQGSPPLTRDVLPATGFIEPGIAAGFLFRTDSGIAFAHNIVTNPDAPLRTRYMAVHAIMDLCVVTAREMGFRHIITWSDAAGPIRRAVAHGGKIIGTATVLGMEL